MAKISLPLPATAVTRLAGRHMKVVTESKGDYEITPLRFDYSTVAEEHREQVRAAALEIRQRLKRTVEDMIEIGRELNQIQEVLHYRQFYEWAQIEFGLSRGSVFEFSRIATRFAEKRSIIERFFSPTIVRRLAAVSVPDEAVNAVIEAAQVAERPLRVQDAVAIVQPFLPVKASKPKSLPAPQEIDAEYTVGPPPLTLEEEEAQARAQIEAEYAQEQRLRDAMNFTEDERLSFEQWWAMMPTEQMSLSQWAIFFEGAKKAATYLRQEHRSLGLHVNDIMPSLSRLIHAMEKELHRE